MFELLSIPALLVVSAERAAGQTVVAAAIASSLNRARSRVAVCKPIDTKSVRRREGLVSEDAEFLAAAADAPHPLDLICPQRLAYPNLPPAVAAERAGAVIDWETINRAMRLMSRGSDGILIESPCLLGEPIDGKHLMLDAAKALAAPTIVVAKPGLASIGPTLSAVRLLKYADVRVAGVVINRYPAETSSVTDEINLRAVERWGKTSLLAVVPEEPFERPNLGKGIATAIDAVDWLTLARGGR
jgi:dethiobiotin synthetase